MHKSVNAVACVGEQIEVGAVKIRFAKDNILKITPKGGKAKAEFVDINHRVAIIVIEHRIFSPTWLGNINCTFSNRISMFLFFSHTMACCAR